MEKIIPVILAICMCFLASCEEQHAELALWENPSTGYMWTVETDPSIAVSSKYQAEKEGNLLGAGGYRKFKIKPTKDGNFHIVFAYKRGTEEKIPYKQIEYSIKVENGQIEQTYGSYKGFVNENKNAPSLKIQ